MVEQVRCFAYDRLGRLTRGFTGDVSCAVPDLVSGPAPFDRSYGYDMISNMVAKSDVGTVSFGAGTAGPHAATSTSGGDVFAYDAVGNMVSRVLAGGSDQMFSYSPDNRVDYVTDLGASSFDAFAYDAEGSRVLADDLAGGGTVTLGGLWERTVTGGVVVDVSYYAGLDGEAAMAIHKAGVDTVVVAFTDNVGSTIASWDTSTGVISHQRYYPYGEIRQTDGLDTTVGFTGQRHDPTGLIYYQARYYDPHTGRFTQPDTIVPGGGTNPQALNRYSYVYNNPTNYTDPTGHDACPGGGGGCGGVREGDENGDGTVPIRGADCGAGCGTEAFWYPTIGTSDDGHPYTPTPYPDEVQTAVDAADHAYCTCPSMRDVADAAAWVGDFAAAGEGAALICSLGPGIEACMPAAAIFAAVGATASVVEFGAGLASADTGHVLAGGVGVLTLGGGRVAKLIDPDFKLLLTDKFEAAARLVLWLGRQDFRCMAVGCAGYPSPLLGL